MRSAAIGDVNIERPAAPVRLEIPAAEIDLPVTAVGVQDDGWMQATVLAAHVDSLRYGPGPFPRLRDLQPGAEVRVTDEQGETIGYLVEELVPAG